MPKVREEEGTQSGGNIDLKDAFSLVGTGPSCKSLILLNITPIIKEKPKAC